MILLLLLLLIPGVAEATTYYVTKTGTGANCTDAQTEATAHNTVAEGLACLSGGDTLVIGPGEWNEVIGRNEIPSGSGTTEAIDDAWPSATTIMAQNAAVTSALTNTTIAEASQTILKPLTTAACTDGLLGVVRTGERSWIIFNGLVLDANDKCIGAYRMDGTGCSPACTSNHHRLINMIIRNGAGSSGGVGMISAGDVASMQAGTLKQLHIKNSIIHDQDANGTFPTSGNHLIYDYPDSSLIEDSRFYNASASGVTNHNGSSGTTIRRNLFYDIGIGLNGVDECGASIRMGQTDNVAYNNVIWRSSNCTGAKATITAPITIHHNTPTDTLVYNNTIYASENDAACIAIVTGSGAIVRNNICYGGIDDVITDAGTSSTISNNRCASGCTTSANPLFSDASSDNFHLTVGSTMIDAGATIALVDTDIEGTTRPQASAYDLGAYEFTPPPPSGDVGSDNPSPHRRGRSGKHR